MDRLVKIGIAAIALAFLIFGGVLWYNHWKTELMKVPPKAPSGVLAKPLSATEVKITWEDRSNNEIGFILYRDGKKIAELPANAKKHSDTRLRPATSYIYEIKAYNQAGESDTAASSVRTVVV